MQGATQRGGLPGIHKALNQHANHTLPTTGRGVRATHQHPLAIRHLTTTMRYMPFFLSIRHTTHMPSRLAAYQQVRGFTLLEVMVVVAIIAVLAALAGPSFTPLIERWRVRQAVENLQSTLFYARSEAIKRGGNVSIRKTANGDGCTNASANTQWGCGWTVFVDTNNNGAQDASQTPPEDTLQTTAAPTGVEVNLASSNGYITTDRWGQLDSATSKSFEFRLVPQGKDTANAGSTALCVGLGGRVKRLNKGDDTCP